MTKIIKFRCVICSSPLGEEEYYVAYEELRKVANQIAKQMLQEKISELGIECIKEIKQRGLV
jgi:hypothetical protein